MARILIVEDREIDSRFLRFVLEGAGHWVAQAADGLAALDAARLLEPQVVISDILLPTIDGYQLVKRLRATPALAGTVVIFYTANYHERGARALAEACGVTTLLTKPSDPDVILDAVTRALTERGASPAPLTAAAFDDAHLAVLNGKLLSQVCALEESERQGAALVEAAQRLIMVRESRTLATSICEAALRIARARYAVLGLDAADGARDIVSCGFEHERDRAHWAAAGGGAAAVAVLGGAAPFQLADRAGLRERLALPAEHPDVTACLGVRLESAERVWGWLIVLNKDGHSPFAHEDARALTTLAIQGTLALENAALIHHLRTDAERLEREIAQRARAEASFRELADAMPHIVWTADHSGHVDYFNRQWQQFAGPGAAGSPGWISLVEPTQRAEAAAGWHHAVASGQAFQAQYRMREHRSGQSRWFLVRATPAAEAGGARKWFGTCTDIDEQKETELRLREANKARDEFLAMVSHELRTPLNAVMGWAKLVGATSQDSRLLQRALDAITRNSGVLARAIDDLLDVSAAMGGKTRLQTAPLLLTDVVASARETVAGAAAAKNILLLDESDEHPIRVRGDAHRLRQVVWNVLSNAIKFTRPGGTVTLRTALEGETAVIRVTDTGIGIAAEFLPFVFERFRQADSTPTRTHGGLGLGLAIARHFVELHGGSIRAESDGLDRGTSVVIELPATLESQRPTSGLSMPPLAPEPLDRAHDGWPSLRDVRALLVDDDEDGRMLLAGVLERAGARVTAVTSAAEAMAAALHDRPSVLVSDIAMPQEDGCSLIRRLREHPLTAALPAIAVTGYKRAVDQERALAAGFQYCLAKPVDIRELLQVVSAVVARPPGSSDGRAADAVSA